MAIAIALAAALAGCANKYEPLPMVGADDPIWPLNAGMWGTNENALTTPPRPEPARPLPAPAGRL
jgi:hypothetical protein